MRPRTKIEVPNPKPDSASEFEKFDHFMRVLMSKKKPAKETRTPRQDQARERLPRP